MASLTLIDDNDDFRRSTAWWLEAEGYTVQEFASGESAWQALKDLPAASRPRCLLLDVRMPGLPGPELHERLLQKQASEHQGGAYADAATWPVIYLTGHGDCPLRWQPCNVAPSPSLKSPSTRRPCWLPLPRWMPGRRRSRGARRSIES